MVLPSAFADPYVLPFLTAPSSNGYYNKSLWSWGGGVLSYARSADAPQRDD